MDMVNVKINGEQYTVPAGSTILEAARYAGIHIPTLCYLKEINEIGACRICVVEVKGARSLVAACVYPVAEGMEISTSSPRVFEARRKTLELILSTHAKKCLTCVRAGSCELQKLCREFKVDDEEYYAGENIQYEVDDSAVHMYRDNNKCILCRRCVAACSKLQGIGVIGPNDRGFKTHIGCAFEQNLSEGACVSCGQCIVVCPTGAIAERDNTDEVWKALADPQKHVIVQTAPSIRVTLGEAFNMPIGTNVTGKMVTALRRLGFDKVFDTNFSADLTIMEETKEFLNRVEKGENLPLLTSCCPAWSMMAKKLFPDYANCISMALTPMTLTARLIKKQHEKAKVVFIGPCAAKKLEAMRKSVRSEVDFVLTFEEMAGIFDAKHVDIENIAEDEGGVNAASRDGRNFAVAGGVAKSVVDVIAQMYPDKEIRVANAEGLKECKKLLQLAKAGKYNGYLLEGMACPGGCVAGAGTMQPVKKSQTAVSLYAAKAGHVTSDRTEYVSELEKLVD